MNESNIVTLSSKIAEFKKPFHSHCRPFAQTNLLNALIPYGKNMIQLAEHPTIQLIDGLATTVAALEAGMESRPDLPHMPDPSVPHQQLLRLFGSPRRRGIER